MMRKEVKKFIESEQLISSRGKVLVALSGGADSVALLRILLDLGYICQAAHCNFHLRGAESDRDEGFVRKLCAALSVPLYVADFDTAGYAKAGKISVEMAARKLRYDWFEQLRIQSGAEVIAVAHHKDDSVETLLLNLIRGTGIDGLRGIRVRNGAVVRPLLCVERESILNYLAGIGQDYVTDSTNLKDDYTRNKLRLNILPALESINPSVRQTIATAASHLDEVASVYQKAIHEAIGRVKKEEGVSIPALLSEVSPKTLLFEILYPLGFNPAQINSVFAGLRGQPGRRFYAPGWCLLKDREFLILLPASSAMPGPFTDTELPLSGEIEFGQPGRKIKIEQFKNDPELKISAGKEFAYLDVSKLTFPLILRKWKQGDRFTPFGMKGLKNVSDYLTDRKFSVYKKEQQFVVCSKEDIVWIVGERTDNRFRVDDDTKEVILLELSEI